jgi:hypothetical protein
MADEQQEDRTFVTRIGPLDIDWARSIGYFGGIAAAVAFELIAPELALFIAAVPLVKLLKRRDATLPERAAAAVIEGAAKPIGGDAQATVRVANDEQQDGEDKEPGQEEASGDHPPQRLRRRVRRQHA